MGLWRIPDKILLPAEPGGVGTFEFNGRLPNGDQVMAYTQGRYHYRAETGPAEFRGYVAVMFRFDADGVLKSVNFKSVGAGDPDYCYKQVRNHLAELVQPLQAEGWVSADILVRLFYVEVDGLATGLIYRTDGEDDSLEPTYNTEEVRLVPFDTIFHRPWTTGQYDT